MRNLTEIESLNERRDVALARGQRTDLATVLALDHGLDLRMADGESMRVLAAKLSLALKVGQIGLWEWNFQTNAVVWDARLYEMHGIAPGTPITFDLWQRIIHPEDVEMAHGIFSRSVQQGLHRYRMVHPSRGTRFIEAMEQLLLDADGRPVACVGVNQDVTELFQADESLLLRQAELERLTLTDPLTGVGNRRKLDEELPKEIRRVRRYGGKLSLLIADIDRLKQVNDEFGHLAGDAVLRLVVHTLLASIRETDWIARFGGDEFCIVLPESGVRGARKIAERAQLKLQKLHVPPVSRTVTASFGVAELGSGEDADTLLQRADQALYLAKKAGRDRIVIHRPEMRTDGTQAIAPGGGNVLAKALLRQEPPVGGPGNNSVPRT